MPLIAAPALITGFSLTRRWRPAPVMPLTPLPATVTLLIAAHALTPLPSRALEVGKGGGWGVSWKGCFFLGGGVTPAFCHQRGARSRGSRRCGACEACLRLADCGRCDFCRDKPKFGGQNLKRQKCRWRQCLRCAMVGDPPPPRPTLPPYPAPSNSQYLPSKPQPSPLLHFPANLTPSAGETEAHSRLGGGLSPAHP